MALLLAACGDDSSSSNNGTNNGTTNNGTTASNNGTPLEPMDPPPADAWPNFRGDVARTGHNPSAVTGRTVTEAWRVADINTTTYGAAKGSPSVWGDHLFIGSDDARFSAFNSGTGELLWENMIPETSQGIHGSPAIGKDHVYVGAYNGTLYAFDRLTGADVWQYTKGFQIGASPVLVPEYGRIYNTHEHSNTGGGWVVCVDARTGEECWAYRIRAHPHSSVAIDLENGMLFVGDNLAIVHGFDIHTGEKTWEYRIPNVDDRESDIKSTPTVIPGKNMVAVSAWSKQVHAFRATDGEILWETDLGALIMSSPAYAPGRDEIYVGTLSPGYALHALDATTGEIKWEFQIGATVLSSPAISGDESLVVVGAHNGKVYAVDTETGEEVWNHDIGGTVSGGPALVGNMVYAASSNGDLVALETGE